MLIDAPGLDTALENRLKRESGWSTERLLRLRAQCSRGRTFARFLVESGTFTSDELEHLLQDASHEHLETRPGWTVSKPAPPRRGASGRNPYMPVVDAPAKETRRIESGKKKKVRGLPGGAMASGSAVGDYVIERLLGAGGMGEVYLAHDPDGRAVAIKTLRPGAGAEDQERFERECVALERASSEPNVVNVYGQGEDHGQRYVVLEYCSGGSLYQRLRDGPLSSVSAARTVYDLANGLEFLHAQGILHRDLKPGNVLFDGDDRAKLTDFGVALISGHLTLTDANVIMGTPGYLSPEQVQGHRERLGPRTDVYGLGAVFYACLTGEPPFRGRTSMEVLEQVVARSPTRPSQINAEVPDVLDAICLKALSKDPDQRFSCAAEFAAAVATFLEPTVVAERGPEIDEALNTTVVHRGAPRVPSWAPWALAGAGWLAFVAHLIWG